jgi:hypothetical protein
VLLGGNAAFGIFLTWQNFTFAPGDYVIELEAEGDMPARMILFSVESGAGVQEIRLSS